ncbi:MULTISPECIES: zinc ribbon domain-containing protein [unclassified Nocardiopsis]|uniref:zinc ribbon domain-containing protein n=1 Tax=Nocardiopsis TaxID=2013 RepID=UPI00387B2987
MSSPNASWPRPNAPDAASPSKTSRGSAHGYVPPVAHHHPQRTACGRSSFPAPQRATLHSWAFAQLGTFISYKAKRAGVPVVFADAAHSSRECADCSYTHRHNRISQALFTCRSCGVVAHADRDASRVLARRGQEAGNAGRRSHVPPAHPG